MVDNIINLEGSFIEDEMNLVVLETTEEGNIIYDFLQEETSEELYNLFKSKAIDFKINTNVTSSFTTSFSCKMEKSTWDEFKKQASESYDLF